MLGNIPLFKTYSSPTVPDLIAEVCESGIVGEGEYVARFAKELGTLFGNPNTLPVNSCTSALHLALKCLGVGPGDEVISTPFTMAATNLAILYCGAKIVWADINPESLFIDYSEVERKITSKTKAIMATAVGGSVDDSIRILGTWGVPLVLDCAHALTSKYIQPVGMGHVSLWADLACFSFQSIKTLQTGDGGALVTRKQEHYDYAEKMKWFGMTRKRTPGAGGLQHQMSIDIADCGYKYQMNNVAAAIGLANLPGALRNADETRKNSGILFSELKDLPGLSFLQAGYYSDPDWWVFGILADRREELIEWLNTLGISSSPLWRRNDKHSVFSEFNCSLPAMDSVEDKILFVPNGWWLSEQDLHRVVDGIKSFYRR